MHGGVSVDLVWEDRLVVVRVLWLRWSEADIVLDAVSHVAVSNVVTVADDTLYMFQW